MSTQNEPGGAPPLTSTPNSQPIEVIDGVEYVRIRRSDLVAFLVLRPDPTDAVNPVL